MEDKAKYGNKLETINIRMETLQAANCWERPNPDEIREIIKMANLTGGAVSELLGLAPTSENDRGSRTVRRWTAGDTPIPYAAWAILAYVAGFGPIWEA